MAMTVANHVHVCPRCKRNVGCEMAGCRDWETKVCVVCWKKYRLKQTEAEAKEGT